MKIRNAAAGSNSLMCNCSFYSLSLNLEPDCRLACRPVGTIVGQDLHGSIFAGQILPPLWTRLRALDAILKPMSWDPAPDIIPL